MSCIICYRLRTLFVAGELCDKETMDWCKEAFKVPVLDHWWQTGMDQRGGVQGAKLKQYTYLKDNCSNYNKLLSSNFMVFVFV